MASLARQGCWRNTTNHQSIKGAPVPTTTTTPVRQIDDDLELSVAAVDDLMAVLRSSAQLGVIFSVSEIILELMPPCGRRVTKRHCRTLATSLAILLQRGTFTS